MIKQYAREDGFQCLAIKFEGGGEDQLEHVTQVLNILNGAGLGAVLNAEVETGDFATDETGEVLWDDETDGPVLEVIEEHISTISMDKLNVGDYVVKRDGDTYIMDGQLFEAIWTESITNNIDDWEWDIAGRRPYAKKPGFWRHKRDEDIISLDGGLSYYRESERPLYSPYGTVYETDIAIGQSIG